MFWESGKEREHIASFIRDYCDPAMRLTDIIRRYDMGLNVMSAHRAARRLGVPLRRDIAGRTTTETIQAERTRLLEQLKALEQREANLRVAVRRIAGDRVSISGLCEQPTTVHLDQLRTFVRGGGLGKLRDVVGRETESLC